MPDKPFHIPGIGYEPNGTEGIYVETRHYLRQMDDGRWIQADIDFYSKAGKETGYVRDAMIHDDKPQFDRKQIIYEKPMN